MKYFELSHFMKNPKTLSSLFRTKLNFRTSRASQIALIRMCVIKLFHAFAINEAL